MSESYVYKITVDGVARYIGMGKGHRVNVHLGVAKRINRKMSAGQDVSGLQVHFHMAEALREGRQIQHEFVAMGLSNEAARRLEIELIAKAPDGQLWNVHSGGGGASAERMVKLWSDPTWRARQIASLQAVWDDPAYRADMQTLRADPIVRDKISQAVTARFSNPVERTNQSARLTAVHASRPELAKDQSARTKARWEQNRDQYTLNVTAHWSDPNQRARQSEAAKRQWADPEGREKLTRAAIVKWTPELRQWRSDKTRQQHADPVARARLSAAAKQRNTDPEFRKRMGNAIRAGKARKKAERLRDQAPQDSVD